MDKQDNIWRKWYAWHPVWPLDDHVFWLETVWRWRSPATGRWVYKSFRSELEKDLEDSSRAI